MIDRKISAQRLRSFSRTFTNKLGLLGLTPYHQELNLLQSRIVYELHHGRDMPARDLAKHLHINKGYLSRSLADLIQKRVVEQRENPGDKRQKFLRLSARGEKLFQKIDQASSVSTEEILNSMSPAAEASLIAHLAAADLLFSDSPPQTDEIILRHLEAGDLGWVISRHGELYFREYGWNTDFEVLVGEIAVSFAKKHDPKKERAWIAEARGVRVGCVFLVRESSEVAKLRILLVEPMARGAGVGSRLVSECIKFAKKSGYKRITLWTNDVLRSARKIYEAQGFTLTKEDPHRSFGKDLIGQYWEKKLD